MKAKKIIIFILLMTSFLLPFITFAHAKKTPSYVGFKEGQTIIWNTEFDKGPLEDYYLILYNDNEEYAEERANDLFRSRGWKSDVEAWKMYIVGFHEELDEYIIDPDQSIMDKYDRVKYIYNFYKTFDLDNPNGWLTKEKYETARIYEPKEELYEAMLSDRYGLPFWSPKLDYPALIVAKSLKWDEIADKHLEEYEDTPEEDYRDIGPVKIRYFFKDKMVGIKTEYDPAWTYPQFKNDLDTFESIAKYTDDGILYYYEYMYDGDTIAKFELKTFGGTYFLENSWWIYIVAGAIIIGVIIVPIVVVILIKKKKK